MQLRQYQTDFIEAVENGWKDYRKQLGVAPTGAGKTIIFSHLASRQLAATGKKTLILAHRDELIDQAIAKLHAATGICAQKEKAEFNASLNSPVVVASVQTMVRRLDKWPADHFGLVVADEAHHVLSDTWRKVMAHFNGNTNTLGVSVGPESCVELVGGCFGDGFVGDIEEAFQIASEVKMPHQWFGFDVIDLKGVYSRGWAGATFCWKPCLRILRHQGTDCVDLKIQGATVTLTPEHSVYECRKGESIHVTQGKTAKTAHRPQIICSEAKSLSPKSVLVGDDGSNFEQGHPEGINILKFCEMLMPWANVECDVKSIPRSELKAFGNSKTVFKWRQAGSIPLKVYRQLLYPPKAQWIRTEGSSAKIAPTLPLRDWAYILGFYLGDGWVSGDKLSFAVGESQVNEIDGILRSMTGVNWASVYVRKMKGKSSEIRLNNIFVIRLLESIFGKGIKAWDKFIPGDWIIGWPRDARSELLKGLIDSDGCLLAGPRNRTRHAFVTTSRKLSAGVCSLLRSLGLWGSVHVQPPASGGVVNGRRIEGRRNRYTVLWSREKTKQFSHSGKRRKFVHDKISFVEVPIRKVTAAPKPNYVYDLEMFGHPSFVANGILVHNTATPDRGDKKSLGEFFENIAHEINLLDLIKQKFLCPIKIRALPLQIDLNQVSSIAGDLDSGELGSVLEPYLHQIAVAIKENVGNRKTLCFLPLISTSQKFVEHCQSVGLATEHIDGYSEDRKEILARFAASKFQVLSNAMLLTEGYDCPDISCVVMLRPTRSRPLYAQAIGRGTRIAPGKEDLLILDFLWMHERHSIVHPASLVSKDEEEAEQITEVSNESGEDQDLLEMLSTVQEQREAALRERLQAMANRKAKFISAEEFALRHHNLAIAEYQPTMHWHSDPCTEKQLEWIEKAGVDPESVQGKGQASQILDVYFKDLGKAPASHKQKWVLQQARWRSDDNKRGPQEATRDDAMKFFSKRRAA